MTTNSRGTIDWHNLDEHIEKKNIQYGSPRKEPAVGIPRSYIIRRKHFCFRRPPLSPVLTGYLNIPVIFGLFTPKKDPLPISPAAPPVILHHTVRRTWLFIAYWDKRWLHCQFITFAIESVAGTGGANCIISVLIDWSVKPGIPKRLVRNYSQTSLFRSSTGHEKKFEIAEFWNNRVSTKWRSNQGDSAWLRNSGDFEWTEFEIPS